MEPIAGFVEFLLPDGTPQGLRLHNYTGSDIRQFQGQDYMLAGFGYSGSVADYNAANTQAQLVFVTTALAKSIAQQATDLGMLVRVFTVFLDPVTLDADCRLPERDLHGHVVAGQPADHHAHPVEPAGCPGW